MLLPQVLSRLAPFSHFGSLFKRHLFPRTCPGQPTYPGPGPLPPPVTGFQVLITTRIRLKCLVSRPFPPLARTLPKAEFVLNPSFAFYPNSDTERQAMNKSILAEQNEWQKVRQPGRRAGVAVRLLLGKALGKGQEKPARLEAAERKLKVSVGGKREAGSGLQRPPATRGAGGRVGKGAQATSCPTPVRPLPGNQTPGSLQANPPPPPGPAVGTLCSRLLRYR